MKLAGFLIVSVLTEKVKKTENDKNLAENYYNAANWLDVEWAEGQKDMEEGNEEYEVDELPEVNSNLTADNWLDVDWSEDTDADWSEETDENDITADNWLDVEWGEIKEGSEPEFVWHGESDIAKYETCCGEPTLASHTPDHPIYGRILPLKNHQLVQRRTSNNLFDDYIWTTWKSYQPGLARYSITVDFVENIVFRELRLVPNPIPFGTWWYNKELRGICVYVDDVEIDCTPENLSLPVEPEEWNYHTAKGVPEYERDHAKWDAFREQFYLSFKSPQGISGRQVKVMTKIGAEAQYGDLKILFDKSSDSKFSGRYSTLHKEFTNDNVL